MYRISYLPKAREDMRNAIQYILDEYGDADAAHGLADEMEKKIGLLADFPYAHPLYHSPMKLPGETRYLPVKNYIVFYTVLEPGRVVEIRRVIYARMNITQQNV